MIRIMLWTARVILWAAVGGAALALGCDGVAGDPTLAGTGGGAAGAGGAGRAVAAGGRGAGVAGAPGTGGAADFPTNCLLGGGSGATMPAIERTDPGVVPVACAGEAHVTPLWLGAGNGHAFDWLVTTTPDRGPFAVELATGSACPDFGEHGFDVAIHPPADAVPGDRFDGTLSVVTDSPTFPEIDVPLHAVVAASAFSLDQTEIDFGAVAEGSSATVDVIVTNLGTAPLMVVRPADPSWTTSPFIFSDWGFHGEDAPAASPLASGASATIHVTFVPTSGDRVDAVWTLTPFTASVDPSCGATATLRLTGSGLIVLAAPVARAQEGPFTPPVLLPP
jgi:hypothetical protein